jgi:hypothetical protein
MTYGRYADDYIRTGFGFGFSPVYTIGTTEAICAATNTCTDARGMFAPGETYTTVYGTGRTVNGYAGTADPVIFTFAVRDHCTGECVRPVYVPEPSTAWLIGTGLLVIWMTRHGKAA